MELGSFEMTLSASDLETSGLRSSDLRKLMLLENLNGVLPIDSLNVNVALYIRYEEYIGDREVKLKAA